MVNVSGRGRIRAISISKIKKIILIMKNRKEKGRREDEKGSNPHSKGDLFSRSWKCFLLKRVEENNTINLIINEIKEMMIIFIIIFSEIQAS